MRAPYVAARLNRLVCGILDLQQFVVPFLTTVEFAMAEQVEVEFEVKGPDAKASGMMTDGGFLVRAGGIARKEIAPSTAESVKSVRQRLLANGVLEDKGKTLLFVQDFTFDSPSGAAAAVLGRTANGWIEWKRTDGMTLSQVKRVARDERLPVLTEAKRKEILDRYEQLLNDGKLPSPQQLQKQYTAFRERFGPSILQGLKGEALLSTMHDHGNHDSLVYWIEFKNDEEFDTKRFVGTARSSPPFSSG